MAQIYRCAFCTISINIPETPDNPLWTNCGYGGEEAEGWVVDTINTGSWKTVSDSPWMALLESGPLGSRAWCLQERQLSPRVIHFLDPGMIMWECCSFIAALGGPIIFGNLTRESKPDNQKRIIDMKSHSGSGHKHMWRAWSMCLSDYTSRSLTIETDRPVAIRGVVDQIKIVTKSEYIYGLWREDLNRGLLWERHASTGNCWTRAPVVNGEQAPTWSWLSITGPVKDMAGNDEDDNPPFMEDTRARRPVFDHSYKSVLRLAPTYGDCRMQILDGPILHAWLDYESQVIVEAGVPAEGRRVAVTHGVETSHDRVTAWACLDITTESYHGPATVLAVTRSYGLLLKRIGEVDGIDPSIGPVPKYQRLGTVRNPKGQEGEYSWRLAEDFHMWMAAIV